MPWKKELSLWKKAKSSEMKQKAGLPYNYIMMSAALKRIIKSGWRDFRRNNGLSMATIFIMVMTISLITSLFLSQQTFNFLITSLEDKVDMAVYFTEETTNEEILTIQAELFHLPEVKKLEYISKEEASAKFTERHAGEEVIME